MNFEKLRREVNRMDESEIVPNWRVFVSIVGREIEERLLLKPPATSPLTISCVLSTECQIYIFYVENILRATQIRVIFNPDV